MSSDDFNVFISWSGTRSKYIAEELQSWLPLMLQSVRPWMSARSIDKGARGLSDITSKPQSVKVGIVCLTPENLEAPWIMYESGALSKTIDEKSRLCTYLLGGLQPQDVKLPLGMFQATESNKKETFRMVNDINKALNEKPVLETNLNILMDKMWPDLEQKLAALPTSDEAATVTRSPEDIVSEVLEITRAQADSMRSIQAQITHVEEILNRAPFGDNGMVLSNMFATGVTGFGNLYTNYRPISAQMKLSGLSGNPELFPAKRAEAKDDTE